MRRDQLSDMNRHRALSCCIVFPALCLALSMSPGLIRLPVVHGPLYGWGRRLGSMLPRGDWAPRAPWSSTAVWIGPISFENGPFHICGPTAVRLWQDAAAWSAIGLGAFLIASAMMRAGRRQGETTPAWAPLGVGAVALWMGMMIFVAARAFWGGALDALWDRFSVVDPDTGNIIRDGYPLAMDAFANRVIILLTACGAGACGAVLAAGRRARLRRTLASAFLLVFLAGLGAPWWLAVVW